MKWKALMKSLFANQSIMALVAIFVLAPGLRAQSSVSSAPLIQPAALVKLLASPEGEKPLVLQVGSHVLFSQAHIPASEYVGSASTEGGRLQLRKRVDSLPRGKFIILYCGCCPWSHCPNIAPAYEVLHSMRFSHVQLLYIADNFGTDWVDKGYPVAKGD
jgi:thiosulfate/3-mercaptopyruvate sulfurtransferase